MRKQYPEAPVWFPFNGPKPVQRLTFFCMYSVSNFSLSLSICRPAHNSGNRDGVSCGNCPRLQVNARRYLLVYILWRVCHAFQCDPGPTNNTHTKNIISHTQTFLSFLVRIRPVNCGVHSEIIIRFEYFASDASLPHTRRDHRTIFRAIFH